MQPARLDCFRVTCRQLAILLAVTLSAVGVSPAEEQVVAAKKSKVYHTRDCSGSANIEASNKVRFKSEKEAAAEGRRLCKFCARLMAKEKDAAKAKDEKPAKKPKKQPAGDKQAQRPEDAEETPPTEPASKEASENAPVVAVHKLALRVKAILPGGTIILESGERARLAGVNCPMNGQRLAEEAATFMGRQLAGRKVQLAWHQTPEGPMPRDDLGRLMAFVSVGSNDTDIAVEMLLEGLAWVDHEVACPRRGDYLKHEDDAAWSQRGVWKRLPDAAGQQEAVVGKHTHKYHAPDCPHTDHLIEPAKITLNEAKGRRLSPCEFWRDDPSKKQ